jgi:ABC-type glycerol-3-phosphate transport system substrate-binding protein
MKQVRTLLLVLASALVLAACSSGPDIKADYDRSVDFAQYQTFNFYKPMGIENPNYSSLLGQMFRDSISRQMEQRGYTLSDNPDLLLNVSAQLEDKTRVTTYNDPMYGGYYGYRRGFYDPWMGYGYGTSTHVSQYTEGTVNVDMVDAKAKRMVWEGVAVGRVNEDRSNDEVRAAISSGVAEMFASYPFRAGQGL